MKTFTYDNGFCKTEVPLISDAHGIKRFMWGRYLTKSGLAEKTTVTHNQWGYAELVVEVEIPHGGKVPVIKLSGQPKSAADAMLLAEHLTRVAAKVNEYTRPETPEELAAIAAAQQAEAARFATT